MAGKKDYYEVLGVEKGADAQAIKKAYRKLAIKFHPDRNKEPSAADRFKQISEAYAVLSDDEKRSRYDQFGHAGIDQQYSTEDIFRNVNFEDVFGGFGGGGGFGNIFDMFFGGQGGRSGPAQGRDLQLGHTITLEEAYRGVDAQISYRRLESCESCEGDGAEPGTDVARCSTCGGQGQVRQQQRTPFGVIQQVAACPDCRGSGKRITTPCKTCTGSGHARVKKTVTVKIPAGIDNGRRIRWPGGGEVGGQGGPYGDLYVEVHVKDHDVFHREGADLVTEHIISFPEATLGTTFQLEHFDEVLDVDVPAGSETGKVVRLAGKGMPYLRGSGRGDILVRLHVETPKKLSGRAKELLEELAKEIGTTVRKPSKKGLFDRLRGA